MQIKLTCLLLLTGMLHAWAGGFSQSITIDVDHVPLQSVFDSIEKQAGVTFISRAELLDKAKSVTLHIKDGTLTDVLAKCFAGQPFTYSRIGDIITLKNKTKPNSADHQLPEFLPAEPGSIPIHGKVVNESGEPLEGVTIKVKGTILGTASDAKGEYELRNIDENAVLEFSTIGYAKQSVPVSARGVINVTLRRELNQQSEIVVVGYATTSRKNLTGAVSSVSSEELVKAPNVSFDAALTGRAPGVQAIKSSGAPGAVASIRIRGGTSAIGTNEPLYVIDGVPIEMGDGFGNDTYTNDSRYKLPALANINIEDIESIDILKDASSAAIYGSRAANGVVIVTTKKGKKSVQPAISFGYKSFFDRFANFKFSMLNANQYHQVVADAYKNADEDLLPTYIADSAANTDWVGLTTRTAASNDVYLNVSGGTKDGNTLYSFSGGITDQQGVIRFTDFNRKTLKASLESGIGKLRFGTNINFSNVTNEGNSNAFFYSIMSYRPDVPLYDAKGNYGASPDSVRSNPYAVLNRLSEAKSQSVITSFFGELKLWSDIKLRSRISVNSNKGTNAQYTPATDVFEMRNGRSGTRNDYMYSSTSTIFDNTITYDHRFNEHYVNLLGGASFTRVESDFNKFSTIDFPDDNVLNNLGSAEVMDSYSSGGSVSGISSYFLQGNYSYADKYLFTFTGRADHSTKFGPANRWGYFPSGAIAWRISKENFLKSARSIDDLKLKVSYGKTGSANFSDFQYATFFGTGSFYNNHNGVIPNTIPNPDIRWESTYQLDAAVAFGFWNNKLYGSVGYYQKTTKDLILNREIIRETGGMNQFANIGDFLNKGWEIQIASDIVSKKDFAINTDLNITRYRSKVLRLNGGSYLGLKEGQPMGYFEGYRVAGIFQSQKEIDDLNAASPNGYYQSASTAPGDFRFVDMNHDGYIGEEDYQVLGKAEPDFFGGWNNMVRYKHFELSAFFTFAAGNYLYNSGRKNLLIFTNGNSNYSKEILQSWTVDNPSASLPRVVLDDPNDNGRDSDFFIENASYFKIKNVQLSYLFSDNFLRKIYVKNIRAFISMTNIYTFTGYKGFDPEINTAPTSNFSQGMDTNIYPQTKTLTLGLNVNF